MSSGRLAFFLSLLAAFGLVLVVPVGPGDRAFGPSPAAASVHHPASGATVALSTVDRQQAEIIRLYFAYFDRGPDDAGLRYWVSQRRSGVSLAGVSGSFAVSGEFQRRYGHLNHQQFVNLIYRNVLKRNPDAGGVRYWTGELGRGVSRGQIMTGFSESAEFVRRTNNRQVKTGTHSSGTISNAGLEAIRNRNSLFTRHANRPAAALSLNTPGLMSSTATPHNGSVGDGQFRAVCEYSHFAYDDPIIHPGKPGASHLHMFFGNTGTNANSTTSSLVNSGGGTCNGFELNRSAYWTPALLDGKGNAVVPDRIILYYKTKRPSEVEAMPQGLKMVVGNTTRESFAANEHLYWSCGSSGSIHSKSNRIQSCGSNESLNATIAFPQCWDGRLDSHDHRSHMKMVSAGQPCPSSHSRRLPQISILLYFPSSPSVDGWHLSSDRHRGFNATPGGTLHADWWGGWNDDAMKLWVDGCMKAVKNCSFGQTGTSKKLARINALETYGGNNFLPLP